jgi:hypothetical protein
MMWEKARVLERSPIADFMGHINDASLYPKAMRSLK